jgi:hypothetical protein
MIGAPIPWACTKVFHTQQSHNGDHHFIPPPLDIPLASGEASPIVSPSLKAGHTVSKHRIVSSSTVPRFPIPQITVIHPTHSSEVFIGDHGVLAERRCKNLHALENVTRCE